MRLHWLSVSTFIVGLTQTIKLSLVGEAVLAELLLPVLGLLALSQPQARAVFRHGTFLKLLAAMLLTLCGYVLSDLMAGSSPEQYLRGWGRVLLVLTGFVSLAAVIGADRRNLWWFAAGMAIGRVLFLRLVMHSPLPNWKFASDYTFGYGEPMTLLVIAGAAFLPLRAVSLGLVVVALASIHYDFRIQMMVSALVAIILWLRADRPLQPIVKMGRIVGIAIVAAVALGGGVLAVKMTSDGYSSQRREVSDVGRAYGKAFAIKAIVDSPIIGYGSWSSSSELFRFQREAIQEVAGKAAGGYKIDGMSSAVHAMMFQAWVEGGVLGAVFFLTMGFMTLRRLPTLILKRPADPLFPVLLYFSIFGLWHVVMSAFAAPLRLHLALAAVCLLCIDLDVKSNTIPARAARTPPARGRRAASAAGGSRRSLAQRAVADTPKPGAIRARPLR